MGRAVGRAARARAHSGGRRGRSDGSTGFVTGIAYDSRAVEPGHVFVALKGLHADGARFAHAAIERGAVAVVSGTTAGFIGGCALGRRRRRAARARAARRGVPSPPERRDAGGRDHRHERQDDDRVSGCVDLRGGPDPLRHPRHRRLPHRRRRARGDADDARGARGAGAAARDGRRRVRRVRDGGVVARAVAAPRRRHDVRRRRVHEPHARPPRFSRRHGGVLPGEAPVVRDAAAGRAEPHQPRRSARRGAGRDRGPAGVGCRQPPRGHHAGAALVFARRA